MVLTGILAISDWVDLQDRLSPTMSGSLLPKYPMAEKKPCTGHASPRLPMLAFDHQRVRDPFGCSQNFVRNGCGAPGAQALYDRNEGYERSERQTAAERLKTMGHL
jgi:hypothetical protein